MEKVVVVGAGASGLMVALELIKQKCEVVVVEARERPGGRIHTIHGQFSRLVEAGAEFMHGSQPLTRALMDLSHSDAELLGGDRFHLRDGILQQGDHFDDQWEEFMTSLKSLREDTDIASFLEKHFGGSLYADLRTSVHRFVEGFDAADPHRVSALAVLEEWSQNDDEHQYHIVQGYASLTGYLEQQARRRGVQFLYSHPVNAIHWRHGSARVITRPGAEVEAGKVVITIPLGVLQQGGIAFAPALPRHTMAFRNMGYGSVIKFFFEFRESFWEKPPGRTDRFSFIFSDALVPTWWSQLPDRTPLLTGWLGGPATARVPRGESALYAMATDSLGYIFDIPAAKVREQIIHWRIEDWGKDPWALGAYAYPTVHNREAIRFLRQPVEKTLYFSGEALYEGPAPGTVEAALVSGKETAGKVAGDWL